MKIELPLENWADLLAFVPRRQLVEIVSQIGDRHFARALQFRLHECGDISLGVMSTHPVRRCRCSRVTLACPSSISCKNSRTLLEILNLKFPSRKLYNTIILQFLDHALPLIGSINSIQSWNCMPLDWLVGQSANKYYQMERKMIGMAKFLETSYYYNKRGKMRPNAIDAYYRWLYTPRDDGKPRVLILRRFKQSGTRTAILPFIDHTKQKFLMAKQRVSFFVRLHLPDNWDFATTEEFIWFDNGQTNERLVMAIRQVQHWGSVNKVMLISRYPMEATSQWIEASEQEALDWIFYKQKRRIYLDEQLNSTFWSFYL